MYIYIYMHMCRSRHVYIYVCIHVYDTHLCCISAPQPYVNKQRHTDRQKDSKREGKKSVSERERRRERVRACTEKSNLDVSAFTRELYMLSQPLHGAGIRGAAAVRGYQNHLLR